MKSNNRLFEIWIKTFDHPDNADISKCCEMEELLNLQEVFPLKRKQINQREYEKYAAARKNEEYLIEKLQIKQAYDLDIYLSFINLAKKIHDPEKIGKISTILAFDINRFFIVYTYQIKDFLGSYKKSENSSNAEAYLVFQKNIEYLPEIQRFVFNESAPYIYDSIVLLKHLYDYILESFLLNRELSEILISENVTIIKSITDLITLTTRPQTSIPAPLFEEIIGVPLYVATKWNKLNIDQLCFGSLLKTLLVKSSKPDIIKKLNEEQIIDFFLLINVIMKMEAASDIAEKVGYISLILEFVRLSAVSQDFLDGTLKSLVEFINSIVVNICGEWTPVEYHASQIPKVEMNIIYHNTINHKRKLFKAVVAYKKVERPSIREKESKMHIMDDVVRRASTNASLTAMIFNCFTKEMHPLTVSIFTKAFKKEPGVFLSVLKSTHFIDTLFSENYINDQILMKGEDSTEMYLSNLFSFIEKFSCNKEFSSIIAAKICEVLGRHDCYVIKRLVSFLCSLLHSKNAFFADGKILDSIIQTDSALKDYLIKNVNADEIVAEARGETVSFIINFLTSISFENVVFMNDQRILFVLSLIYEDDFTDIIFTIIEEKLCQMKFLSTLIWKIVSFLNKKFSNMNSPENTQIFMKMLNFLTGSLRNKESDIRDIIVQPKFYAFIATIPEQYIKNNEVNVKMLKELETKVINFFYCATSNYKEIDKILNQPPFEVFQKLLVIKKYIPLDNELQQMLIKYITFSEEDKFNKQIYNCGPLNFLFSMAIGSPLLESVSNEILGLVIPSISNRYQVFKAGVLPIIMEQISLLSFDDSSKSCSLLSIVGSSFFHKKELLTALRIIEKGNSNALAVLQSIISILGGHENYQPSFFHIFPLSNSIFTTIISDVADDLTLELSIGMYSQSSSYEIIALRSDSLELFVIGSKSFLSVQLAVKDQNPFIAKITDNGLLYHWSTIKIYLSSSAPMFVYNETILKLPDLVKTKLPSTFTLEIKECEFSQLTIKTMNKKVNHTSQPLIIGDFNAKSSEGDVIINNAKAAYNAFINNCLIIEFSPSMLSSLASCGGPAILLPLFESSKIYPNRADFIMYIFNLISILIRFDEKLFIGQHFFSHLVIILKSIDKSDLSCVFDNIERIYSTIKNPELKTEMVTNLILDLSLSVRIPKMLKNFFTTRTDLLQCFPSFDNFLTSFVSAMNDNKIDEDIYYMLLTIFTLELKYKESEIADNFDNIIVLGYDDDKGKLSRLLLEIMVPLTKEYSNLFIGFFRRFDYAPIFIMLSQTTNDYLFCLQLKLMCIFFSSFLSDELVAKTYRLLSFIELKCENAEKIIVFVTNAILEPDSENLAFDSKLKTSPSPICHHQLLPLVCRLVTLVSKETANSVISLIVRSITKFGISKPLKSYFICMSYLMFFTGEIEKMTLPLLKGTIISTDIYFPVLYATLGAHIFGREINDVISRIGKVIIEKRLFLSIDTFIFLFMYTLDIDDSEIKPVNNFVDFFKRMHEMQALKQNMKYKLIEQSSSMIELEKMILNMSIDNHFTDYTSELSWFLLLDVIKAIENIDKPLATKAIMEIIDFIMKSSDSFRPILMNFVIKFCRDSKGKEYEQLIKEKIVPIFSSNEGIDAPFADFEHSIFESFSKTYEKIFNIFCNEFAAYDSSVVDLFKNQQEYLVFVKEHEKSVENPPYFEREKKHRNKLWNDLKNDLKYSLDGIWSNSEDYIHKEIDFVTDCYGRHYRMKPNRAFDLHKEASVLRDSGIRTENTKITKPDLIEDEREHKLSSGLINVYDCQMMSIKNTLIGKLYVTKNTLSFDADFVKASFNKNTEKSTSFIEINTSSIMHLLWRRYQLIDRACEIMTNLNKSYFLIFTSNEMRNDFISTVAEKTKAKNLKIVQKKPMIDSGCIEELTECWLNNSLSTYQYLFWLNMFAGRSFNDLSQYPVFPWVLSNYTTQHVDFNDKTQFRDFNKPVGTFNKERLEINIEKYESSMNMFDNCLYRSHYSTPAYVILWLMRCEPFTTLHIDLQQNKFDKADRLFSSVSQAWDSVNSRNQDFRELIPEFFSLSEFLMNKDNFDLGVLQNGTRVNDVILPPWSKNAPSFILMNRLALESPFVSKNISSWIDLIFGYKQRGEESVKAYNTFSLYSYYECLEKSEVIEEVAVEYATNFGITPDQLFTKPHPSRFSDIPEPLSTQSPMTIFNYNEIFRCEISDVVKINCYGSCFYVITSCGVIYHIRVTKDKEKQVSITSEKYPFSTNSPKHVCIFPNSNLLVCGAPYKITFDLISLDKKEIVHRIPNQSSAISCISGSEYQSIVSCGIDSSVTIWGDAVLDKCSVISGHTESVVELQSSGRLDAVVSVDKSKKIIVSSILTGKPYSVDVLPEIPKKIFLSEMGLIIIVYSGIGLTKNSKVEVRDLCLNVLNVIPIAQEYVAGCIGMMPDCVDFFFGCFGTKLIAIRLCDLSSINIIGLDSHATSISFSSDEMCVAVSTVDGNVRIYNYILSV